MIYLFVCLLCVLRNFDFYLFVLLLFLLLLLLFCMCKFIDRCFVFNRKECLLSCFSIENLLKNFVLFSFRRRITCRKGEVQRCQRRTRHDIERIVGLLINFWWWRQQHFFYMFFPLLSIIPKLPLCEFICAQQWLGNINVAFFFFQLDHAHLHIFFSSLLNLSYYVSITSSFFLFF